MKKDKPPVPMVRKSGGKLSPVSAYDEEELANFPDEMLFDMVARNKRTLSLHRVYWTALQRAIDATGRWASRDALHVALKVRMGLVAPLYGMKGEVIGMIPDSTAFAAMDQGQFKAYFDGAMAALSEAVGYDALAFLNE